MVSEHTMKTCARLLRAAGSLSASSQAVALTLSSPLSVLGKSFPCHSPGKGSTTPTGWRGQFLFQEPRVTHMSGGIAAVSISVPWWCDLFNNIQCYFVLVSGVQHHGWTSIYFTKCSPHYFQYPLGSIHSYYNIIAWSDEHNTIDRWCIVELYTNETYIILLTNVTPLHLI